MTALPQSRAEVRLPFAAWPEQDRIAWEGLFIEGDLFDETGGGGALAICHPREQPAALCALAEVAQRSG